MGYSGKLGLEYSECDTLINNLKATIDEAGIDEAYLVRALNCAQGCRGIAINGINTALTGVSTSIKNMIDFKSKFETYYSGIKEFDNAFSKDIDEVDNIIAELQSFFTYATSGKDGALGSLIIATKAYRSNCVIYQKGKYFIIKGAVGARKGIPNLEDIKSTKYKEGSAAFNKSGVGKYVPKGTSISDGFEKFKSNVGSNIKGAFDDGVGGFAKNTFAFDKNVVGNVAKGMGYASIALDAVSDVKNDYDNGTATASKVTADITVDVVRDLGGMATASACAEVGFAIGTAIPIPIVGSVVGAAAGFALGYVGSQVYNKVVSGASDWAKDEIKTELDNAGEWIKSIF